MPERFAGVKNDHRLPFNECWQADTPPGRGGNFILVGHTTELSAHVGDEMSVTGRIRDADSKCIERYCEYALSVASFKTIVRKNPAGVRPRLDDPKHWSTFTNKNFGVTIRLPKTFLQQNTKPENSDTNFVDPSEIQTLQIWTIPRETYPGSNFVGGEFSLSVNPAIRSEGSCLQFTSTRAGYTSSKSLLGKRYTEAELGFVGLGTGDTHYYRHTFQDGYCYEFAFEFDASDGTGIDEPCLMQWLVSNNEQELVNELLSGAEFVTPDISPIKPMPNRRPIVKSLEHSLSSEFPGHTLTVSWSTEDSDYVKLQYPCIQKFSLVNFSNADMKCGGMTDYNFPPNGSVNLGLMNDNPSAVSFVLTVEPFSDGVGYPEGSKAATIEVLEVDGFHSAPH